MPRARDDPAISNLAAVGSMCERSSSRAAEEEGVQIVGKSDIRLTSRCVENIVRRSAGSRSFMQRSATKWRQGCGGRPNSGNSRSGSRKKLSPATFPREISTTCSENGLKPPEPSGRY